MLPFQADQLLCLWYNFEESGLSKMQTPRLLKLAHNLTEYVLQADTQNIS